MTTYKQEADALSAKFASQYGENFLSFVDEATAEVEAGGIYERQAKAAPVGGQIPQHFQLRNLIGTNDEDVVDSAKLLEKGALVLVFFRGGWCPYCNLQLRALEKVYAKIKAAGAELVAISPEKPAAGAEAAKSNGLSFPVVCDGEPVNAVARSLGLVYEFPEALQKVYLEQFELDLFEKNGRSSETQTKFELPVAGTFVFRKGGVIEAASVRVDWRKRMEPAAIVDIVEKLADDATNNK